MNKLAQQRLKEYLDSWLEFRRKRENIPGYVVAISEKGKTIYTNAFGCSNMEAKSKMMANDIFRIASHSKTFTATALMQLQEKDKLRIDDYASKYIGWLKNHKDKRFQKVTIRQLMSHSAGVIRDGLDSDFWKLERPFPELNEFKEEILKSNLVYDTNIKMKYSNFGYTLLGLVIENASGLSYEEYINANIIVTLGLKNTGVEYNSSINSRLVTGYTREEFDNKRLPVIKDINTKIMAPATGFYSNAEDMLAYFNAHLIGSGKLLDDESKKEMQRIQWKVEYSDDDEAYGLGFDILNTNGKKYNGHGGGFPGQITKTMLCNDTKTVVTILTNSLDSQAGAINKSVFSAFNYFVNNKPSPKDDLFNGRFMNIWTMADIIVTGKKAIISYPDLWNALEYLTEAKILDDSTLKITKENSFFNEGELIKIHRNQQKKITKITYGGGTMLPEAEYIANIRAKKRIG